MPCHDPVDFAASLHVHPVVKRAKLSHQLLHGKPWRAPLSVCGFRTLGKCGLANWLCNGPTRVSFQWLDFLDFGFQPPTSQRFGMPHRTWGYCAHFQGGSCPGRVLSPGADFTSRCEFATNTSGWLATNECQFMDCPDLPFLRSNCSLGFWPGDIDLNTSGNLVFPNNQMSILPVLCGAHWAAIEIQRRGIHASINVIALPRSSCPFGRVVNRHLAWPAPDRLRVHSVVLPPREHFCGWQLLSRWIVTDVVPPREDGYDRIPLQCRHLVIYFFKLILYDNFKFIL